MFRGGRSSPLVAMLPVLGMCVLSCTFPNRSNSYIHLYHPSKALGVLVCWVVEEVKTHSSILMENCDSVTECGWSLVSWIFDVARRPFVQTALFFVMFLLAYRSQ